MASLIGDYAGTGSLICWLLLVSFVYALSCIYFSPWRKRKLSDPMGPGVWDPKQSWVTTMTAIGALLVTVLSARPELPFKAEIPATDIGRIKAEFSGFSIFFGALILIAPLFYVAKKKSVDTLVQNQNDDQYQGYVWSFLVTCLVTLWGAAGQLLTLLLLFVMFDLSVAMIFLVLVGATFVGLLPYYVWRSIAMKIDLAELAKQDMTRRRLAAGIAADQAASGAPPLPEWSIL